MSSISTQDANRNTDRALTAENTNAAHSTSTSTGGSSCSVSMVSTAVSSKRFDNLPSKTSYFAVKKGHHVKNCIFLCWEDCQPHVDDESSQYASFMTLAEAEIYLTLHLSSSSATTATVNSSTGNSSSSIYESTTTTITTAQGTNQQSNTQSTTSEVVTVAPLPSTNVSPTKENSTQTTDVSLPTGCNTNTSNIDEPPNKKQKRMECDTIVENHWMKMYHKAVAYGKVHGDYNIPPNSTNQVHIELRQWIEHVQHNYQEIMEGRANDLSKKLLTRTRINKLHKLHFPFDPRNITTKKGEKMSAEESWRKMYNLALAFKREHGTFNVPSDSTNEEHCLLRRWIQWQRKTYQNIQDGKRPLVQNKFLTEAKIKKLQKLGFPFVGESTAATEKLRKRRPHPNWMTMLEKVKEYYQTNHTFEIPFTTTPDGVEELSDQDKNREEIRTWLNEQNNEYANMKENRRSTMTADKIQLLADIGYEFHYVTFAEHFEELKEYMKEHGTREIPVTHPLAKWARKVKGQMRRLAEGKPGIKLSDEQAQQLRDIGFFPGNIRAPVDKEEEDRKWDEMYEKMKEYKKEHGDCLISTTNWQDPLVKWTVTQRRYYKTIERKGSCVHLDTRKLQKLHEIGFVFKQVDGGYKSFEERLEELNEFKAKHGHLRVPTNQIGTGGFVAYCRDQYRLAQRGEKHSMTEEKFQVLRDMGFEFQIGKSNPRNYSYHTWDQRFEQLMQYKGKYGNTVVPQHFTGFNNLGQWVKTQRDYYKLLRKGKKTPMTPEQALKLSDVGFVWDAQAYKRKKSAMDHNDDSEDDNDDEDDGESHHQTPTGNKAVGTRGAKQHSRDVDSSDEDGDVTRRLYNMYC